MVTRLPNSNQRRPRHSWQPQWWWCSLPILGITLCLSVFAVTRAFASSASYGAVTFRDKTAQPTTSHNSEGLAGPLDLEQCKHLPQLRMCSHQMRGATTTWGILAALRELFQMGICCFDIDIVTTSDQQLLVTHPSALQDTLNQNAGNQTQDTSESEIHFHTLKDIRQLGANLSSFPSAAEYLEEYARLIREAAQASDAWHDWDPHRMPLVFLELKGAAFNTDAIDWLWAEVLELGIVNHVALYVTDDTQPGMLAQQTHWQGLLIRGFRDTMNDDEQRGITSQTLQASTLMSPSIKLPQSFYSQLQQIGKPVFSWVVDSPLQLRSALSKNVDGIISNDPLFLKLVLKSWWKRCRSAQ
ncbi:hypothetical protein WJX79_005473 [Trebouxia sp. C0005]